MSLASRCQRVRVASAFWRGLDALGLPAGAVLRHARLPATLAASADATLTLEQHFALWQAVGDLSDDPAVGVGLAAGIDPASLPPAFLAATWARDYREALGTVARFKSLCTPEAVTITEGASVASVDLAWPVAGLPSPAALTDATFASLLHLGRRGTGRAINAVRLDVRAETGAAERAAFFGCPVRLGQPTDRLVLALADLVRPFRSANAEMVAMVTPQLDAAVREQATMRTIAAQVRWSLTRLLPGRTPDVAMVARELGLSARTLQRRIADEGTSYRALLAEARQDLVRLYLRQDAADIAQVAYLVGYDDPNSLYRAFRGWEGVTPAQWRAAATREHPR